jgi:hypothetical protein
MEVKTGIVALMMLAAMVLRAGAGRTNLVAGIWENIGDPVVGSEGMMSLSGHPRWHNRFLPYHCQVASAGAVWWRYSILKHDRLAESR